MRITQELLWEIAEDTVSDRVDENKKIVAAYLHGSVLEGDPVLGGAADIDLVFIHEKKVYPPEAVRLTEDIHLDIQHHLKSDYEPPRALRTDTWKGAAVYACKALYDPDQFLDFTQASVRGMYYSYENILGRAQPLLKAARKTWINFHNRPPKPGPDQVRRYLRALENIANAIGFLNGPPLTVRRLLQTFPERAEALGHEGLFQGFVGLLGSGQVETREAAAWLPAWDDAYQAAGELKKIPPELHPNRWAYYRKAMEAMFASKEPRAAFWPMLYTWTLAVQQLPEKSPHLNVWNEAFSDLGLTGKAFDKRVDGLDAYLDLVEEIFDTWKQTADH